MNPVSNPYSPGAGLRPRELAGRDAELTAFDVVLERTSVGLASRSQVLYGLRGVGKTVLVNELADHARGAGWIVGKVEATTDQHRAFRAQVAQTLNRALREVTGSWGLREKVRRAFATFKSFSLTTDASGAFAIGIEVDPQAGRADTGHLDVDLADLALDLADAAKEYGVGVLLVVDEMHGLSLDEMAAVCQACHEVGQRSSPFSVVGAGLPSLPRALAEARSYAERLFDYRELGPLSVADAIQALVRPAEDLGVRFVRGAAERIVEASGGYPYFLQEFGKAAWDFAPGPSAITTADVEAGIRAGTLDLDHGFYRSRWERATRSEREYLRAMAEDGDGPSASGEVAHRLGRTQSGVGPTRAGLIAKGLVFAPEHGQVAFTVPGMADYIRRHPD
jgi:AAA ATPase-like protein